MDGSTSQQVKNSKNGMPDIIPRELLFGNPIKSHASISPDGKRIAYLAPSEEGIRNVWIKTIGTDDDEIITRDTYRGIPVFFWPYNNRYILYAQDKDGDENYHLYCVDIESKQTKDITPFEGVKVNSVFLHPEFRDEIIVGMNKRDKKVFDLYRLSLTTGDMECEAENPGDVVGWSTDHDFITRVAHAQNPGDGSTVIRVRDSKEDKWRDLISAPFHENVSIAGFTEDNKNLLFKTSMGGNTTRLVILDFKTGTEIEEVYANKQSDICDIIINKRTYKLEAVSTNYKRLEWKFFDTDMENDFKVLRNVDRGDIQLGNRDYDDKKWIVTFESDDTPIRYYLYERETNESMFLFSHQPDLEQYTLATMDPVIIKSRDGMDLVSYLTLPVGIKPEGLPLVLLVHGGPWARDTWGMSSMVQWLSNREYAVLQVNYRGSVGFGKNFLNAGNGEWGTGYMQHDLTDSVQWVIDQGVADPGRIAIMGASYGGYAVLAGLTFTPELYKCGVDIVGPSHLKTLLQTIPPYWIPAKKSMILRVGDVENDDELNKRISPLFHVDKIQVPLLIGQGQNDPRVKISESDQIVNAMKEKGLAVEYIVFPDEGHGFMRPENRLDFFGIAEEFLAKHLGGRKEPYKKIEGSTAERR